VSHIIHSIGNKGQKIIDLLTSWIHEFPVANPEFSTNLKDSSLLVDFFCHTNETVAKENAKIWNSENHAVNTSFM
jgi:hypothetical protein